MSIAKSIGEKLQQARKSMGKTQKEVAQIFHMTQQQYSRFETGVFELNYQQLHDLCVLLKITPNELFGFEE